MRKTRWPSVEPQAINVYGFDFTPTFALSESYDDNFREVEHDVESTMVTRLAPAFELPATAMVRQQGMSVVALPAADGVTAIQSVNAVQTD